MSDLKTKLTSLPHTAGVYFFLDDQGQIIYIGKATNLKARVSQYFLASSTSANLKLRHTFRDSIADVRFQLTTNALQALFLEGELIKRYQPKFNVLLRNKHRGDWLYVKFSFQSDNPNLQLLFDVDDVETDSQVSWLGPYIDAQALRRALKYLRRSFPYSQHKTLPVKACLDYHLQLCPGPETATFDYQSAVADLKHLHACLQGKQDSLIKQLTREMTVCAKEYRYEEAIKLRNQINALNRLKESIIFRSTPESFLASDQALLELQKLFQLPQLPQRICAFDVSHISGQYVTAAMVVAVNGVLRPDQGRRFKARLTINDDYAQMKSVIERSLKFFKADWPDLLLIDGGRGQVSAALAVLVQNSLQIPVCGLAKKNEEIVFQTNSLQLNQIYVKQLKGIIKTSANFTQLQLPARTEVIRLLQRLRDASHRSALRYHNYLQARSHTTSALLDLPGIGPASYARLKSQFGSLKALQEASFEQLTQHVSSQQAQTVFDYCKTLKRRNDKT